MDGLPSYSSNRQFWPIPKQAESVGNGEPFIIDLFYGNYKPTSIIVYLEKLIQELNGVKLNGFRFTDQNCGLKFTSVICDTPARAFIKYVKQVSGYHGYDKCTQSGTLLGKMTNPDLNSPLRSDLEFLDRLDEETHKGPSPFEGVVGMISQFF